MVMCTKHLKLESWPENGNGLIISTFRKVGMTVGNEGIVLCAIGLKVG